MDFLSLSPHCALKQLETPSLYDIAADELYELDGEAYTFLASSPPLSATRRDPETAAFVKFCMDEGLAAFGPSQRPLPVSELPPLPTLRYLLVHITDRCNLKCRHCFLGEQKGHELSLEELRRLAEDFTRLQGLRFIVSGGEPLLHRNFQEFNEEIRRYPFRSILLTNGTLMDDAAVRSLRFHEVQVSLDGLEDAHDLIRGKGSYRRTLKAMTILADAGTDLSVATMVHRANLDQFDSLRDILMPFPLKSWSVDVPCLTGSFTQNRSLAARPEEAAPRMGYSFGGGYYGSSGEYACGAHLAAVMSDGAVCKCGHFADRPEGRIDEGIAPVWERMRPFRLDELTCRCSHLAECRGGCRYRAQLYSCIYHSDPIHCLVRGVPVGGDRMHDNSTNQGNGEGG